MSWKNLNYFLMLSISGIWTAATTAKQLCGEPGVKFTVELSPRRSEWGVPFPKGTSTLVAWIFVGAQSHSKLEALQSARSMPYSSAFSHGTSFLLGYQRDRKNICVHVYSYRHNVPLRENRIWPLKGVAAEIRAQISEAVALSLPALYLNTLSFEICV